MSVFGQRVSSSASVAPAQEMAEEQPVATVAVPTVEATPPANDAVAEAHQTPLEKAAIALREKRAKGELVVERLTPVQRAQQNPTSLRKAITAHCFQCCGSGADPNVRQSVRDCAVTSCSLHPVRPWQKVTGRSAGQMTEDEIAESAGSDNAEDFEEDATE